MSKEANPVLTTEMVARMLFGSYARLQLGMWIARRPGEPRRFTQAEYHEWCLAANVQVAPLGAILRRFENLGMIEVEPPDKRERRKYYNRLESPLWAIFIIASVEINAACDEPRDWARPSPSPMRMRKAAERLLELHRDLHE